MAAKSRKFSFLPDPLWRNTKSEHSYWPRQITWYSFGAVHLDLSPSRNDDRDMAPQKFEILKLFKFLQKVTLIHD